MPQMTLLGKLGKYFTVRIKSSILIKCVYCVQWMLLVPCLKLTAGSSMWKIHIDTFKWRNSIWPLKRVNSLNEERNSIF